MKTEKDYLIHELSELSSVEKDYLIMFMNEYRLINLISADLSQLKEFVVKVKNNEI